jgi:SWI/SNF related-matrix-associated actin-dependent regulator of chromatin subfamily C
LRIFCNALPAVDCTARRYHCIRHPDVNLCPQAFAEGRFPPGISARDFILIDATGSIAARASGAPISVGDDGWSDQETLLLLEALELYGESWPKVAEYVGKSRLDCVLRFAQLPVDDELVARLESGSGGAADTHAVRFARPLYLLLSHTCSTHGRP